MHCASARSCLSIATSEYFVACRVGTTFVEGHCVFCIIAGYRRQLLARNPSRPIFSIPHNTAYQLYNLGMRIRQTYKNFRLCVSLSKCLATSSFIEVPTPLPIRRKAKDTKTSHPGALIIATGNTPAPLATFFLKDLNLAYPLCRGRYCCLTDAPQQGN